MPLIIEIHKAKEIILQLNNLALIISGMDITKSLQKQLLNHIDEIKSLMEQSELREEKNG